MSGGPRMSNNDRDALYAALDMVEEIVTAPFFRGTFGAAGPRLVELNAKRRKRLRIADLEHELAQLKRDS